MQPQQISPLPEQNSQPPKTDPTKTSQSLAIALVVSVIFLLAAAGIITWLLVTKGSPGSKNTTRSNAASDTASVKKVSLLPPADLPPQYVKNDQSTPAVTQIYYYDDATNCGITAAVAPIEQNKTLDETVTTMATAGAAPGVKTTQSTKGQTYAIKDADGKTSYSFDSLELTQDVRVPGVGFTTQSSVSAFKQFGAQAAILTYACKTESWPAKKAELAALITKFTAKTER